VGNLTVRNKIIAAVAGLAASAALIHAYSSGPDPRYTGAPGDNPLACSTSGCHTGTDLNGGGGNVVVKFPDGLTYTPGKKQTFTIIITDSKAKIYGFQMTARLESDLANGQAGDFAAGVGQFVICDNGTFKGNLGCPKNNPVEFIEHSSPFQTNTILVTWTPPATDVGNIHIYVAANAANADGNNTGDHIYNANYTLSPAQAGCANSTPAINAVVSASAFNPNAGLAPGAWLEIYGSNLSCTTRGWADSDFTNNGQNAPTSLDGIQVTIDGIPAYVDFVSPLQVNVQAPDDPNTGPIQIVLQNSAGASNAVSMTEQAIAPALLAPPSFQVGGKQYVVAQFPDQTFVGPPGLIGGVNFRPAKVGDVVVIYGVGCGPVTPATPAGVIVPAVNSLQNKPNFRFGQVPATLSYFGLTPGFVGLYQFNLVVPNVTPGDIQLNVDTGGAALNQTLFITVGQ
jgi:uncharacterized protein (TIGR03437 family)